MKQQQITEGNKLIAKFMNHSIWGFVRNELNTNTLRGLFSPKEFKKAEKDGYKLRFNYHSSWESLMPVFEKIEKLKDGTYKINSSIHQNIEGKHETRFWTKELGGLLVNNVSKNKMESVWKSCVEFIEWYNKK